MAFSIRVQPHGTGRSLVLTETRTAATDPGSRRRFRRYWRVIGPFSGLTRRQLLGIVRADAERQTPPE